MIKRLIILTFISILIVSCANNSKLSGDIYSASEAKKVQRVTYGTLIGVRQIHIQGGEDSNVIGAIGGAVLGGFLGNTVGSGSGRNLATAAGIIAGSVTGSNLESIATKTLGVELEVRKDDGTTIIIIQKQGKTGFITGQRVALISQGSMITVSPR